MAHRLVLALAMVAAVPSGGKATMSMEAFGFDFAEDGNKFVPKEILGEAMLKQRYVPKLAATGDVERPFLTEDYPLLTRVAEMGLLTKTADAGILTTLTEKGLTLSQIEGLLPLLDELGLLEVALGNKQLLLNLVAPLLVEPAPLLLGPLVSLIKVGGTPLFGIAAIAGIEGLAPLASGDGPSLPLLVVAGLFGALGTVFSGNLPLPGSGSASPIEKLKPEFLGGGKKGLRI